MKSNKLINYFSILFFLLFFYSSCTSSVEEIKEFSSTSKKSVEITTGVTMYYSDMGNSKLKLVSPLVYRYNEAEEMILECPDGMEITFYDTLQNVESILFANYGKMFTKKQYMLVKDNVVFHNSNKDTLYTNLLNIYFAKDSIYTNHWVKVSSQNGVVTGTELVANSNFTFYRLMNIKDSHIRYEENETERRKNK